MARAAAYDRDTALQAAMVLFWRKGYHATSLKDLEAALNMKPGSIYAAFASKENLYLLALKRYFDTSRGRFRARVAQSRTPLSALADNLRAYARIAPDDTARRVCMLTKTLVDTQATNPKIAAVTREYLEQMRGEFAQAFRAARDSGALCPDADPDRLARRYQANVTALRLELHRGAPQHEVEELAEDMAREVEALRP